MDNSFKLITKGNVENEHICCALSDKKCNSGYLAKKNIISERIDKGFHFVKLNERSKVFIEFVPAEYAWAPVNADGYIFIHCFWVSGKFKGLGFGKKLLEKCETFAKENKKKGIVAISSDKKRPFISDKKFFLLRGFEICDNAEPYYELLVKKYNSDYKNPVFRKNAKIPKSDFTEGIEIIYSNLCPFNAFYSEEIIRYGEKIGIKVKVTKIDSLDKAKNVTAPSALFNIFYRGKFITHEILTEKKFTTVFNKLI